MGKVSDGAEHNGLARRLPQAFEPHQLLARALTRLVQLSTNPQRKRVRGIHNPIHRNPLQPLRNCLRTSQSTDVYRFHSHSPIRMGSHVTDNADVNLPALGDQSRSQRGAITRTCQQPNSPLAIRLSVHQDGDHCDS